MGNLLHPITPRDDPKGVAQVIAQSEFWTLIHLVIVLGIILMFAGLIAIRHSIQGGLPEAFARLGVYAATVGVTVGLITVILDGVAAKQLADQWAMAPDFEKLIALSLVMGILLLRKASRPAQFAQEAPGFGHQEQSKLQGHLLSDDQLINKEIEMRKVVVFTNLTLDGVMQAPGRPNEDLRGGFQHGGWATPYAAMSSVAGESLSDGVVIATYQPAEPMAEKTN